ncbi:replication initiation protein [Helicobacter baculiformis]|uniref:Replication initiation protein n=1 Tax=Helicobacter baculiformis TaxID=427351 RepID=A0ABV7ZJZ8_9HELI|nr:replication initiation protein [Helicobacter baculiformis]
MNNDKQYLIEQIDRLHALVNELVVRDESDMQTQSTTSFSTSIEPIPSKQLLVKNPLNVVLHNDIYKVNLGKLSALENNLLFSIFAKLKEHGDAVVRFTSSEIKSMLGDPKINNSDLLKSVKKLWENICTANFWKIMRFVEDGEELVSQTNLFLFRHFNIVTGKANGKLRYIEVGVNTPYYTHLLNDLKANFTSCQLKTFVEFTSKYTKTLFRLLVRFEDVRTIGLCKSNTYQNDWDGFKEFMGIPKYMGIGQIEKQILKPACKELGTPYLEFDPNKPDRTKYFEHIWYEKIKKGRSHKIVGIVFCFMPQPFRVAELSRKNNRILATLDRRRLEKDKEEYKRQELCCYYTTEERHTLNSYIGNIGSVFVSDPDHLFKQARLYKITFQHPGKPCISCAFEIINATSRDSYIASLHHKRDGFLFKEDNGRLLIAKEFEDYKGFIEVFSESY